MKISLTPIKKLSIQDLCHITIDDLIQEFSAKGSPYNILWCDGVLFVYIPFSSTYTLINQEVKGNVYWKRVIFAKLDKYQKTITRIDGSRTVQIFDASKITLFTSFTQWLKSQKIWSKKVE